VAEAARALLDGVRVLELSQLIAAPFCGLTLADLGAEVVKVEPPGGDYTRSLDPPLAPGRSAYFQMLNRGKRSVALDLRADGAQALVRRLIDRADVVVDGLGDAAAGLAVGYDEASERNPKLIWCSVTGLGRQRGGRTIDPNLQAAMGMMATTGEPGGRPLRTQMSLIDFMTGMYAVQSVLATLMRVERGGSGALLDCAMVDAAATLTSSLGVYALGGAEPLLRRIGAESYWYVPAGNFEAADGEWVQLVAISEQHWRAVCRVLGHPEWIDRFTPNERRVSDRELVHELIADAIKLRPAEALAEEIRAAGGLCERIREMEEAWSDPLLVERGLLGEVSDPQLRAFPIPVASLAGRGRLELAPAPALGEHSRAVAAEAGLGSAEIDALVDAGALVDRSERVA
jgi:crotonobetainyl-CoA:carnitine CoA-transferase CaiB-like acyl-CoA transferase